MNRSIDVLHSARGPVLPQQVVSPSAPPQFMPAVGVPVASAVTAVPTATHKGGRKGGSSSRLFGFLLFGLLLTLAVAFGVLLAALLMAQEPTQPEASTMGIDPPCDEEIIYSDALAARAPSTPGPPCSWTWRRFHPHCGPSTYCRLGLRWRPLPHPTCRPRY